MMETTTAVSEAEGLKQLLMSLAIREDLPEGDITSDNLFDGSEQASARIVCRQPAVISGIAVAEAVFQQVDPAIRFTPLVQDGDPVVKDTPLLEVSGPTRSLLKAERLALNFLQHLSGIATTTYQYVGAVSGMGVDIKHTRKTLPGLRAFEIDAVVHGGGVVHRRSLSQAVMIKDNHLKAFDSLEAAVERLRQNLGTEAVIEVECDTLEQLDAALAVGAQVILLDNMDLKTLKEAVKRNAGRAVLEASGGVTLKNVLDIARTGVNVISTSQITLSTLAVDIGLDFL